MTVSGDDANKIATLERRITELTRSSRKQNRTIEKMSYLLERLVTSIGEDFILLDERLHVEFSKSRREFRKGIVETPTQPEEHEPPALQTATVIEEQNDQHEHYDYGGADSDGGASDGGVSDQNSIADNESYFEPPPNPYLPIRDRVIELLTEEDHVDYVFGYLTAQKANPRPYLNKLGARLLLLALRRNARYVV
mmetsp:Transcript_7891/g.15671  ORF Transcript_7891/g.15671 Transcript_7891/m.15671 type:complete len:195 (-) Transcript_7891:1074-1658(-)